MFLTACPEIPEENYDNPLDPGNSDIITPALIFFPDTTTVNIGFSATLKVFAKGVNDLSGAYIEFEYDNTKLSLLSISEGDFFQDAEETIFFTEHNAEAGVIQINTAYLGDDSTAVNGTGSLASIIFTTTVGGSSDINYTTNCELLDPDDKQIVINNWGTGVIYAQ